MKSDIWQLVSRQLPRVIKHIPGYWPLMTFNDVDIIQGGHESCHKSQIYLTHPLEVVIFLLTHPVLIQTHYQIHRTQRFLKWNISWKWSSLIYVQISYKTRPVSIQTHYHIHKIRRFLKMSHTPVRIHVSMKNSSFIFKVAGTYDITSHIKIVWTLNASYLFYSVNFLPLSHVNK